MKSVKLPNDLNIEAVNEVEAKVLYMEFFVFETYGKHGIHISPGDCVLDVGANIGFFPFFLSQQLEKLQIFAVEPIPELFEVLKANAGKYCKKFDIHLLNKGLSDKPGNVVFDYDPGSTLGATFDETSMKGSHKKGASLFDWISAMIADMETLSVVRSGFYKFIAKCLKPSLLRPITLFFLLPYGIWYLFKRHGKARKIECEISSISQIIEDNNLTCINLVKIDTEGSELKVIEGIKDEDWAKIEQFIIEVHDYDGRIDRLKEIFENRGYTTLIDREAWKLHELLGIYIFYAVKKKV